MGALQEIEISEADGKVSLSRADYDQLIERIEDLEDLAHAKDFDARYRRGEVDLIPWDVAKRLRHEHPVTVWRDHRGLTQRALAAQATMTAAQLSEIENGKKTGSVATLKKLASALGVTIDELLPA